MLSVLAMLSGCGGGDEAATQAPAGLRYTMAAAVYAVGQAIPVNAPTSSGGPITGYGIAPALPAGLQFDMQTGKISGTPTAVAAEVLYTIVGSNAAGSATATLRISVQAVPVAPATLAYDVPDALYVAGEAIASNLPQVTGGVPSTFSVVPALPAGLSLDAESGAITGTPAANHARTAYTVTARNGAGSASAVLRLTITGRGSWAPTASLVQGRHYFSATKLPDGKVLVAGGWTNSSVTAAASLYDPATGTWAAVAPMLVARMEHSATLLPDGRVLVAGGENVSRAALATAEIYDPAAGTWTATGAMSEGRVRHTVTLLPDGRLLVVGGHDLGTNPISFRNTAERYDPATGTWSLLTTRLAVARTQHAAELLPDGNVLVAAGVNRSGFITSAEVFPVNDSGSTMQMAAVGGSGNVAQAVRLADGSVLVTTDGTTAWRFHPATSTWTTSTTRNSRILPTMTVMADGRVLLAGGSNLATAEIYNPDANVWTAATPMSTVRRAAAAVLLNDGSVLVVGGVNGAGEVDIVERYVP